MKKTILTIAILVAMTDVSIARDEYNKTFDSIYVAQKIYYSLDAKLNKVFNKLKAKLSKEGKKVLIKSENTWVTNRDHKCAYPETNSVNIGCAVSETKSRLHFLEDRVRECEELGCKIDKLK